MCALMCVGVCLTEAQRPFLDLLFLVSYLCYCLDLESTTREHSPLSLFSYQIRKTSPTFSKIVRASQISRVSVVLPSTLNMSSCLLHISAFTSVKFRSTVFQRKYQAADQEREPAVDHTTNCDLLSYIHIDAYPVPLSMTNAGRRDIFDSNQDKLRDCESGAE